MSIEGCPHGPHFMFPAGCTECAEDDKRHREATKSLVAASKASTTTPSDEAGEMITITATPSESARLMGTRCCGSRG